MITSNTHTLKQQSGATLVEYAMVVGILVVAIAAVIAGLQNATLTRADKSMETTQGTLPCDGELSGEECL